MKKDNNVIQITNMKTSEVRYFTKDSYVQYYVGCTQAAMPLLKANCSKKFPYIKYEIVDGSNVLYKDINNVF